ncbi:MAG: metal-dependent hydrolase [Armatimonadota bacterium]|nr:metal-dependent hydrolase [Armatimonadota bacterium]
MTWPTHALLGINSLWLLSPLPTEVIGYYTGTLAAVAACGALLPDLDASQSQIKHLQFVGIKPFSCQR